MDSLASLYAVKHLSASEALLLLKYLHKWAVLYLDRLTPGLTSTPYILKYSRSVGIYVPSHRQVMDLIGHVLDAHFAHLSLLPSAHEVLGPLQEVIQKHVRVSTRMLPLIGPCTHILDNSTLPNPAASFSAHYSIELCTM
mmetsp:Transcript_4366/g.5056  ORF Transcript_4366/g.5056 Transcript_4366/m.5056 type:complete len:140 (+) Transcript_4366:2-421(+)